MNRNALLLLAPTAILYAAALGAAPAQSTNALLHGVWRNPLGTVDVAIADCGQNVCGVVTAASQDAITDARDAGYPRLVGMQLLHNYRPARPGRWTGTVTVPDLDRTFSSHIELLDPAHARISGCLWHQYFCQSQVWRRI
jgi:uncharacterized protein (DUF2147 family)